MNYSNFSWHPLLPTVEQTGVQFLYSISQWPTFGRTDITRASGTRAISNGVREISGVATPGSVAELRVDGGTIARTRVRLDGSYDFPNVVLPTRGYSEVAVLILDRNSGETQDYSRRSGIELPSKRQHSVFGTVGEQGSSLDDRFGSLGGASAAQWCEDLTIELGHKQIGEVRGSEASISMVFFNQWFGSLGYAEGFDRNPMGLDLEGGNELWRFVLPSVGWNNNKNFTVSAWPNSSGSYCVDTRFKPTHRDTARYSYEHDNQGLGRARFGIVSNEGSSGYALDWESRFFSGFNSRFRLSKGDRDERVHDSVFFQWQMTFDFAVAQIRIVPADSNRGSLNSALGIYTVAVERDGGFVVDIEITISDDFLFEQDLVVP